MYASCTLSDDVCQSVGNRGKRIVNCQASSINQYWINSCGGGVTIELLVVSRRKAMCRPVMD